MTEKSNETRLASETQVSETVVAHPQEVHAPTNGSRRFALNASVMGGLAALLAACGKYTSKYDKSTGLVKGKGGEGDAIVKQPTPGTPNPNNPDPNPSPTAAPIPTATPDVPPPLCVDTSGATPKTPTELLLLSGGQPVFALYGSISSALLALKFKSSGTDALGVGDRVHVLSKKMNGSMILGTRVVSARDLFSVPSPGYGLVFESLDLNGAQKIEGLVSKAGAGAMVLKMQLDFNAATSFKRTLNAMPVIDLSIARRKVPAEVTLLSAFTFGQNAPSMAGTSDIGNSATLGAMNHGGSYTAATPSATWSTGSLVNPAGNEQVIVQTIFGETVTLTPANNHFLEHQSVVVYARRTRLIAGVNVTGYVRYFVYVG